MVDTPGAKLDLHAFDRQQPMKVDFRTRGRSGLRLLGGMVFDESLGILSGRRGIEIYREMGDQDAVCGTILYTIDKIVRQVRWRVERVSDHPRDREAADFLDECREDLEGTWTDLISEIMSMCQYGHSLHEIVYKRRAGAAPEPWMRSKFKDGRIGWRGMPIRSQDTLNRWLTDDFGNVVQVEQLAPPNYAATLIPMEKCLLFRTSAHKNSPVGRSVLRSAYACFAADTDLLTTRGWVSVGDIHEDDQVATLKNGVMVHERPSAIHRFPYNGELVRASGRRVDQMVTPNHRMWVRRRHHTDFEFIEADDVPVSASLSAAFAWHGTKRDSIQIGEHVIDFTLWCRFAAFWLAEGSSWRSSKTKHHMLTLHQKKGPKADQFQKLLDALPFSFCVSERAGDMLRWDNGTQALWNALGHLGNQHERRVPRYMLGAEPQVIRAWLEVYLACDGTMVGTNPLYAQTPVLATCNELLADDLQEAGLKAGWRAQKAWHEQWSRFSTVGGIWLVSLNKNLPQMRAHWSTERYVGEVHCVTTTSGVVMTRRNGKASWSGNSFYKKRAIENIEAVGIERDLAGLPVAYVPADVMAGSTDADRAMMAAMKEVITNIRRDEQEGVIFPREYDAEGRERYSLQLLTSGGSRNFDVDRVISRYDSRIAMCALADFLLLGQSASAQGSWAMHSDKTKLFLQSISAFLDIVQETFNRFAVPRLFALNTFTVDEYPRIVHDNVEQVDLEGTGKFIQSICASGAAIFPDAAIERRLCEMAGLPVPVDPDKERPVKEPLGDGTAEDVREIHEGDVHAESDEDRAANQVHRRQMGLGPDVPLVGSLAARGRV